MVVQDFRIVVRVFCQAMASIGVEMVIPEFKIATTVSFQAITVVGRMEKEYGMVGLITITIPGVIPTTINIL